MTLLYLTRVAAACGLTAAAFLTGAHAAPTSMEFIGSAGSSVIGNYIDIYSDVANGAPSLVVYDSNWIGGNEYKVYSLVFDTIEAKTYSFQTYFQGLSSDWLSILGVRAWIEPTVPNSDTVHVTRPPLAYFKYELLTDDHKVVGSDGSYYNPETVGAATINITAYNYWQGNYSICEQGLVNCGPNSNIDTGRLVVNFTLGTISAVPEPASLALAVAGLAVAGLSARRRARA